MNTNENELPMIFTISGMALLELGIERANFEVLHRRRGALK